MQDKRDVAIGLQLSPSQVQVTWFSTTMKEPVTGPLEREEAGHVRQMEERVWKSACGMGKEIALLRDYLKDLLLEVVSAAQLKTIRIMVTVPRLTPLLSVRIPKALELLGLPRKNIYLQDYLASFFYYAINQKRELWNADVVLLTSEAETVRADLLHIDRTKSPALATVQKIGDQPMGERERDGRDDQAWDQERDRLFFEFLKKIFERRNVVTCFLVGDYFSVDWAERSFRFLTSKRHAFQGENLYTRGACYGAMQRCGMIPAKDILFMGADIIRDNLSMNMRVNGKEVSYPLVTAGINWYEAHFECEMIADDGNDLVILSHPMDGSDAVMHILRMHDFPERPMRASRLRLSLYFTSPQCCCLEVEDLGFGGLYRPSGMKWSRRILC